MYVICDPMLTLENGFWFRRGSYVEALKYFFCHNDCKEALVFRDVRSSGSCDSLQFIALVKRKNFEKSFSILPRT